MPNHTSDQHEWFKKSVAKERGFEDFYVWHDGYPSVNGGRPKPPNNWVRFFTCSLQFPFDLNLFMHDFVIFSNLLSATKHGRGMTNESNIIFINSPQSSLT